MSDVQSGYMYVAGMVCCICEKEIVTAFYCDGSYYCHDCHTLKYGKINDYKMGWKCPECGRVFSPTVTECWYCNHLTRELNDQNDHLLFTEGETGWRCSKCKSLFGSPEEAFSVPCRS